MYERRKDERLKDFNEITVHVISGAENLPKGKVSYNYYENISASGAKIRGDIFLPVDTLLKIDFALKILNKQVTVIGKVKWIRIVIENSWYEADVEFVDTPYETIETIKNYISLKQKHIDLNPFNRWFGSTGKINKP
ncbi:MAG: PilZ domain-containing protein [Deltaproteobacteria bacterium]|nr:PilZ domain-containing protein [Deltaproteobacteria bacterium]